MVAIELIALEAGSVPATDWHVQRISFCGPHEPTGVLDLHARLNVVAVASERDVDTTVDALRNALLAGGEGTHVELAQADGDAMVMFRPIGGRQRLIDIGRSIERPMTDLFDLVERSRVAEPDDSRAIVDALSRLDQAALWGAADRLLAATGAATPPGDSPSGAPTIDLRARRGWRRRRNRDTAAAPVSADRQRAEAEQAWRAMAGSVPIEVASLLRARCEATAQLLTRLGALAAVSNHAGGGAPQPDRARVLDTVEALVPLCRPGAGPHIVAVPGTTDPELASLLLDNLAAPSVPRQLIVVSADERVLDWARLEHHAGRAALQTFGA